MKDISFSKSIENEDVFSWKHNDEGIYTFVIDEDGDVIINYTPYSSKKKPCTHFIDAGLFKNYENETGVSDSLSSHGALPLVSESNASDKTGKSTGESEHGTLEKITDSKEVCTYFIASKKTSSATICENCGHEKFLHKLIES